MPPSLTLLDLPRVYSDARKHGPEGPSRSVRLPRTTSTGGGAISTSEDRTRCVVAGKDSLRILRASDPSASHSQEHKFAVGSGGYRIDASRNFWDGSGLKIDSASTDVAWCHGTFSNKILTSARNGDLIMWDLNKSGSTKYERRTKDHIRSIQKMSCSPIVPHYCVTGSADGDVRVWDLRTMGKSIQRIHHATSVRSVVFSRSVWKPLQIVVGLDNGSLFRWDLQMGMRGRLDRRAVAHSGPILALDWSAVGPPNPDDWAGGSGGGSTSGGWVVSGSMDRCVKVWDLTVPESNFPHKPTYTLHPAFPVRRVLWREGYNCELAVVSSGEFNVGASSQDLLVDAKEKERGGERAHTGTLGDSVEIWDVRRPWVAKWEILGSAVEGGATDIAFADSYAMWAQHSSGSFSQLDLRESVKPLDAIPRLAVAWEPSGTLAFAADRPMKWEIPYDDVGPDHRRPVDRLKHLGDSTYSPTSQSFGHWASEEGDVDVEVFSKLASKYVIEGENQNTICSINAEIAFQHGKIGAGQVWLLLASLLPDMPSSRPPSLPPSPQLPSANPSLILSSVYTFPPRATRARSSELSLPRTSTPPVSPPLRATSSLSPSPRPSAISLPPANPLPTRRPSMLGRHESSETSTVRRKSVSSAKRSPSTPVSTMANTSPNPGEGSKSSLRGVGEGALDDSDTDSSGNGGAKGGEGNGEGTVLSRLDLKVLPAHRSPLSAIGWTDAGSDVFEDDDDDDEGEHEDEDDDEASPSPQSTDSGLKPRPPSQHGSVQQPRKRKARTKTHGRSLTIVSLAAARPIPRKHSKTSERTVTADGFVRHSSLDQLREMNQAGRSASSELSRERKKGKGNSIDRSVSGSALHKRKISHAFSGDHTWDREQPAAKDDVKGANGASDGLAMSKSSEGRFSEKATAKILADEVKFREMGWAALRDAVEAFAAEGDVQTCALLSLVAGAELQIDKRRVIRFIDSYIDLLHRLQLFTAVSYLRKHGSLRKIKAPTQLETIIYTSCGRCHKPIIVPAGHRGLTDIPKGGYSYCQRCRSQTVKCSICHLPVRAFLFQCSVCGHGGHLGCYRSYYLDRPMIEVGIPTTSLAANAARLNATGVPIAREDSVSSMGGSDDGRPAEEGRQSTRSGRFMAHVCAAGCGHHCWAAYVEPPADIFTNDDA